MCKNSCLIIFLILLIVESYSQETYTSGGTEYYYSQFYVTTGKPRVKRCYANRIEFLRSLGLKEVPEGFEVDHIIPLFDGGADDSRNMQLLTVEQHRKKTTSERRRINNKYSSYEYPSEEEYYLNYNLNHTNLYPGNTEAVYSGLDFAGRPIFLTASGRYFYFNHKGEEELLIDDE